jgi:hypothetical protein
MKNNDGLISRRQLITGITGVAALGAAAAPSTGQAEDIDAIATRAKAALKAKGTKLVLLGTGGGRFLGYRAAWPQM